MKNTTLQEKNSTQNLRINYLFLSFYTPEPRIEARTKIF